MKNSIADTLKLESNFCIKRLIRLCKDSCNSKLITEGYYCFTFKDCSVLSIKHGVITIDNSLTMEQPNFVFCECMNCYIENK